MTIQNLLDKCREEFSNNNYEQTIELCDEVLKKDLNNQSALGYKARSLDLLGRCEEALTLLNNAMILYPDNYHYLCIKAEVLMGMEEYDNAIGCFEEVFEIGVDDETALAFIKMDYETCFSLKIDWLIERERYVEAWKCYTRLQKMKSNDLNRKTMIDNFKEYVKRYTSKGKRRQYYVKISSDEAKQKLMEFLGENGFECSNSSGLMFLIDVVGKTFTAVSVDEVGHNIIISESKFYDKVNYYPRDEIEYMEMSDEYGNILYKGYTLNNAPYGFGRAYFADGNLYRDGIFDIKGIVQGKEYYPSGQLRFEGQWSLTTGYGPNAPYNGNAYGENGELIYSGKFEIKRGGVGWPMIQKPKGFGLEQKQRPKIDYL